MKIVLITIIQMKKMVLLMLLILLTLLVLLFINVADAIASVIDIAVMCRACKIDTGNSQIANGVCSDNADAKIYYF